MATILDYTRQFEKYLRLRNNAQSTIEIYTGILKKMLFYFKKDPLSISPQMIGDFILTINAPKTKRQAWYTIDNFYKNVLHKPNYLKEIPLAQQKKYIPETLSTEEVFKIINSTSNLKHRALLQLIYSCALRLSEAIFLKISDIDGTRKQIHIKQSKGAKDRIIPIPEETLLLLRNYFAQYKPKEFLFNGDSTHLTYSETSVQQIFHQAKRRALIIKKVTLHSLRHSRATHLLCNGVDIKFIAEFLGHNNIKTTTDFYIHTNIIDLQNVISKADFQILGKSKMIAA